MDFRDKVFLAVAEKGSFTKGASEVFISQPAVTRHIRELENSWGCSLLDRTGSGVVLTEAGRLLYRRLKEIQGNYQALQNELSALSETARERIPLGASTTVAQYILPEILAAYSRVNPKVQVQLFSGNSQDIQSRLLTKEVDLALVENDSSSQGLKYLDFQEDEIIAVCGRDTLYSRKPSMNREEILSAPLVLRESGSGTREVIQRELKSPLVGDHIIGTTEGIKGFLRNFDGISLVSKEAVREELFSGSLKEIPLKGISFRRMLRLAFRQGALSPSLQRLVDFILGNNK